MKATKLNTSVTLCNTKFTLYSLENFNFDETIEIEGLSEKDKGLYYFCKRATCDGQTSCHRLYLGKSENLDDRPLHKSHEKWKFLKKKGCNCIGLYKCKKGEDPKEIESEILTKYNFELNKQENTPKDEDDTKSKGD